MKFAVSIIIPTHKRSRILRMCLEAIQKQTILRQASVAARPRRDGQDNKPVFEVIVVSDGPDPRTDDLMLQVDWQFERQYFTIPKSQQGVARNRALEKARGQIVLLIGDDDLLMPDAVEKHVKAHELLRSRERELGNREQGSAVLGYTTWDPTIKVTKLMRWMERSGVQFQYPAIAPYAHDFIPEEKQQWFSYTANISLPARLAWKYRFREDVSLYGWEDIEWGARLADAGIPLYYEPDAKALHHHPYTDADVWERSKLLGQSARVIEGLVPNLPVVPRGWKKLGHWLESWLPTYRGKHWRAFFRGMRG